ncbi:MAG: type 4a pilus biogenesis protein PilO [Planctomycetes bacterium]|nr:type 4a pilus biogenesis protein PilO [Planctomycetota bacterium]
MLRFVPVWAMSSTSLVAKFFAMIGIFVFLYQPVAKRQQQLNQDYVKGHDELMKQEELIARIIPGLEEKMKWVRAQLQNDQLLLPGVEKIDDGGVEVGKAVEKSQVTVDQRTQWTPVADPAKKVKRLWRDMTVSGSYEKIANLLQCLMVLPYAISIDELEIAPKGVKEKGILSASMKISMYFQEPQPEK